MLGMRRVLQSEHPIATCLSRRDPKGLPFGLVLLHTFLSNKEKYGAAGMTSKKAYAKSITGRCGHRPLQRWFLCGGEGDKQDVEGAVPYEYRFNTP